MNKFFVCLFIFLISFLKISYSDEILIESEECGDITYAFEDFSTPSRYEVGDIAEGGVVIYMYPNGINGVVASEIDAGSGRWACNTTNSSTEIQWGAYTGVNEDDINSWVGEIGDGEQYSEGIYNWITNGSGNDEDGYFANQECDGSTCLEDFNAVELCYNFNHNGFTDWYLPNQTTLYLIYQLKETGVLTYFNCSCRCGSTDFGMI